MTAQTAPVYAPHQCRGGGGSGGGQEDWLAHKGMVNAANFVYDTLRDNKVCEVGGGEEGFGLSCLPNLFIY